MQSFDALTMRAILQEARPVLLNRRVEKVYQLARDEVVVAFRSGAGTAYLVVSAQPSFGRLCLTLNPTLPKGQNVPPFGQLLRKHLSGAMLVGLEQLPGERVADLTFACIDELGNRSTKILTAEIMGRHSNLILWDRATEIILGASHNVTPEMSRRREIATGHRYSRPPTLHKRSIFEVSREVFVESFEDLRSRVDCADCQDLPSTFEQWLMMTFSGLGRHLAEEIVDASHAPSAVSREAFTPEVCQSIWQRLEAVQQTTEYSPSMCSDLSKFSVLSWYRDGDPAEGSHGEWKFFPSVNDLIDAYFRGIQLRTEFQQLKDRMRTELRGEEEKLQGRLQAAENLLESAKDHGRYKKYGDLILANLQQIGPGDIVLSCDDLFGSDRDRVQIDINPNLSPAQNAQNYYRLYSKARTRQRMAEVSRQDAMSRLNRLESVSAELEKAESLEDLQPFKERILDRGKTPESVPRTVRQTSKPKDRPGHKRLTSITSSDGFTIIVGRNRHENDFLVGKLTQPHDLWLHAQGLEGAHVVIKLPNKTDPPATTLSEAAQVAARFARAGLGGKVKVVYTYGKYVKKVSRDKPGLVRYENEKVIEVDTSAPMSAPVRKLFA